MCQAFLVFPVCLVYPPFLVPRRAPLVRLVRLALENLGAPPLDRIDTPQLVTVAHSVAQPVLRGPLWYRLFRSS